MTGGFKHNTYLEASTKTSGVPLQVKHSETIKTINLLLCSR